jgi:hypothetical protein
MKLMTDGGVNNFNATLGLTSTGTTAIKPHTFYGSED